MEIVQKRVRARRSESQWRRLIAKQRESGLGIAAFCGAERVKVANFYRWQKRIGTGTQTSAVTEPSFVDLGAVELARDVGARLELRIEIGRLFKLNLIRH